ncbi:MAG: universal stress protein [Desulfobacterales bacterium]
MKEIKKILVAIAFSEYSSGIFSYGAKLAGCTGAEIVVANIINSRDVQAVSTVTAMGYEVDGDNYVTSIKKERSIKLNRFIKESDLSPENIKSIFRVGNPSVELLKIAVEEDVDLIVMGIKAKPDWEHFFVGSVAEKLFRRSPATILFCRDEKQKKRLKQRISLE